MRTNIDIDNALIREAMRRSGATTKKAGYSFRRSRRVQFASCGQGPLGQESESIPSGTDSRIVVRRHMVILDTTV